LFLNISLTFVLALTLYFERLWNFEMRRNFELLDQQEQLLDIFNNLIKIYNDGLVITSNEDIVFYNQKFTTIFED
jgi:hypothetical protein